MGTDERMDGRTDGRTDMKLLVAFYSFVNAPRNGAVFENTTEEVERLAVQAAGICCMGQCERGGQHQSISNTLGAARPRSLHPHPQHYSKGNNFLTRFPVRLGQAFSLSCGFADSSKWPKVTLC
jgi:hypothetical protein